MKLSGPKLPSWATLEYDNGVRKFDPKSITLYLEPEQVNGQINGKILKERLSNENSINLSVLQYFEKNPTKYPQEWKGKWIYAWGTIVRNADGHLYVPYVYGRGGLVVVGWYWLGFGWRSYRPAARFASSPVIGQSDSLTLESAIALVKKEGYEVYKRM